MNYFMTEPAIQGIPVYELQRRGMVMGVDASGIIAKLETDDEGMSSKLGVALDTPLSASKLGDLVLLNQDAGKTQYLVCEIGESEYSIMVTENTVEQTTNYYIQDISDQVQNPQNLARAEKMEVVQQFAKVVAHDFNNLIGVVSGYATLVQNKIDNETDPKLVRAIEAISDATKRMQGMTDELLAFAGVHETKPELVKVNEVFNLLVEELKRRKGIKVKTNKDIGCDKEMTSACMKTLTMAFSGLAAGLVECMEVQGDVTCIIEKNHHHGLCKSCWQSYDGEWAKITIASKVNSVASNARRRMFEPFYFKHFKPELKVGAGMAFSKVHSLIHGYGGHIDVKFNLTGMSIELLMPIHAAAKTTIMEHHAKEPIPIAPQENRRARILLVDDDVVLAKVQGELLEDSGFDVTVTTSSKEALNMFQEKNNEYDVVITDYTMPELTGGELAKAFIKMRPNIPIIMCTGFSEYLDEKGAEAIGIRNYLYKPVKLSDLVDKINKSLWDSVNV